MPENRETAYYHLEKYHAEIFPRTDPVSFHELLFMVEAPYFFTGINIWEYVSRIPIQEIKPHFIGKNILETLKLSRDECEIYPYYELLFSMYCNMPVQPLIVGLNEFGDLIAFEGRHRLRLMALWNVLEGRYPEVPCIMVKKIEDRPETRIPEKYAEWQQYLGKTAIAAMAREAKRTYAKFLRA